MANADDAELERSVAARAFQHDFRLMQRETDEGQVVFEWARPSELSPGPQFVSRRLAIEWMTAWLDGPTPAHGVSLPPQ